jgi:hypothetical protein
MISDSRLHRSLAVSFAAAQTIVTVSAFVLIVGRIVPGPISRIASWFPPFSVGTFNTEFLILALMIHFSLVLFVGVDVWLRAIGFAARLAVMLVFFGIGIQALFELLTMAIHKLGLDFFGLFDAYAEASEEGRAQFAATILQQPLFVSTVLPSILAMLYAISRLVDRTNMEGAAAEYLQKRNTFSMFGLLLAAIYFFARCFTHVAHFVIPMAAQILREERFEEEIKAEARRALARILLPEAVIGFVYFMVNKLGRVLCGSVLLAIEYVPMWSSQVVMVLLGGSDDSRKR